MNVVTFLRTVQSDPFSDERIELRYITPSGRCWSRFYESHAEAVADGLQAARRVNVYHGIGLRAGHDGSAKGVTRIGAAWCETDGKLWANEPDPKLAAIGAALSFAIPISVLVDSGGGAHLYFLLDQPLDARVPGNRERIERVNAALGRAVCGPDRKPDGIHDVARILRLPGTFNHKPAYNGPRPVSIILWNPTIRNSLDDLEDTLRRDYPWAFTVTTPTPTSTKPPTPIPTMPPGDLRERAGHGRIRRETLALLDTTGPDRYRSASEADSALAAGLISAGLTEPETFDLIVSSIRGEDAMRRKGPRFGQRYWERTIAKAAAFVGPVLRRDDGLDLRYIPNRRHVQTKSATELAKCLH